VETVEEIRVLRRAAAFDKGRLSRALVHAQLIGQQFDQGFVLPERQASLA
jgi:hypothetical protein